MNAITQFPSPREPGESFRFYDVIAKERDALSRFLREQPQNDVGAMIALLAKHGQPVTLTGIGKSGHIAAKIAATFSSLGTPAQFVNAGEAAHGDLGLVRDGSLVIMLSNSGTSQELARLVPFLRARGCILVAIVGTRASPLGRAADHVILAEVAGEADHIGMAPTASTTLQLAIGDALAVAASHARGFTREDFLQHHPAGLLGRQMVPVSSVMRQGDDLPLVCADTPLLDLLSIMSAKRMGAACVVDENHALLGLVVDGDVRRQLQTGKHLNGLTAGDIMQTRPITVRDNASLGDVLSMQKRSVHAWLVLPVVDGAGQLKGMLHAQDLQG